MAEQTYIQILDPVNYSRIMHINHTNTCRTVPPGLPITHTCSSIRTHDTSVGGRAFQIDDNVIKC